jgi:hypothetical protein
VDAKSKRVEQAFRPAVKLREKAALAAEVVCLDELSNYHKPMARDLS